MRLHTIKDPKFFYRYHNYIYFNSMAKVHIYCYNWKRDKNATRKVYKRVQDPMLKQATKCSHITQKQKKRNKQKKTLQIRARALTIVGLKIFKWLTGR